MEIYLEIGYCIEDIIINNYAPLTLAVNSKLLVGILSYYILRM